MVMLTMILLMAMIMTRVISTVMMITTMAISIFVTLCSDSTDCDKWIFFPKIAIKPNVEIFYNLLSLDQ